MIQHNVAVLLATYNGLAWLPIQLESILGQLDVEVSLYISDDFSEDGSYDYLQRYALHEPRVHLLPQKSRLGSAGKNFYRLILDVDIGSYDYLAFADQDDIWETDKLINHIRLLNKHAVEGVSSNVMAFWADGKKRLIYKSQPQREFDYLFESAGPGCTFLMTPWLVNTIKDLLNDVQSIAHQVALHDWLTYAVCRASGRKWLIDSYPSVQYRQHSYNVLGANHGFKARLARVNKMSEGWYRGEVLKIVEVCSSIADHPDNHHFDRLHRFLNQSDVKSRFGLLSFVGNARRRFFDRLFLATCILIGLF